VKKISILGWVLLPFNIIGIWFCVYSMQSEINILYLVGTGFFVAQFIYVVKTHEILKHFENARQKLDSAVIKAALSWSKSMKGEKGGEQD
jgi:hypothetical protein